MEHSSAYIDFKKQLKETGKQKLDGYYPDLLYCINADERKEIEKDIWTYFVKKDDAGLAIFMPYLEDYDGIGALKKKLSASSTPRDTPAQGFQRRHAGLTCASTPRMQSEMVYGTARMKAGDA